MKVFLLWCIIILASVIVGFGAVSTLSWLAGLEFLPIHRGPELAGWLVLGSAASALALTQATTPKVLDLLGIPR